MTNRQKIVFLGVIPIVAALIGGIATYLGAPVEREQIVLTGEAPDPARIPSGCRFHPRCPVMLPECTSVTLPILGLESGPPVRDGSAGPPGHDAACVRVK